MAVNIKVTLTDNIDLIKRATEEAISRGLEAVGTQAEAHAENELAAGYSEKNDGSLKPKGNLAKSLTHTVKGHTVTIGSALKYAIYVHEGTGKYNSSGGTDDKYWVFVTGELPTITDEQKKKNRKYQRHKMMSSVISRDGGSDGKRYTFDEAKKVVAILRSNGLDAHMTNGIKPNRFLKNAIMNNLDEYKNIFENELKKELT